MGSRSPVAANKPTVASSRAGDKRCPGREPVHLHTGRTVNSSRIADISCSWQRAWSTSNLHNRFRPRTCCERVPGLRAPQSPSPPASASLREYPTQLHQAYLTGQNMAIDQDIILISDSLKVRCPGVSDISASFRSCTSFFMGQLTSFVRCNHLTLVPGEREGVGVEDRKLKELESPLVWTEVRALNSASADFDVPRSVKTPRLFDKVLMTNMVVFEANEASRHGGYCESASARTTSCVTWTLYGGRKGQARNDQIPP